MVWKKTLMCLTKGHFGVVTVPWLFEDLIGKRYLLLNSRWVFEHLFLHFNDRFPKHLFFANFQCLRCGDCCNHERTVYRKDIERWITTRRFDILEHVFCSRKWGRCINHIGDEPCEGCRSAEIVANSWSFRCPFVRKVPNKLNYTCRIDDTKPEECSEHLCEKSLPVANLDWTSVEELIQKIGIERYKSLIKKTNARRVA